MHLALWIPAGVLSLVFLVSSTTIGLLSDDTTNTCRSAHEPYGCGIETTTTWSGPLTPTNTTDTFGLRTLRAIASRPEEPSSSATGLQNPHAGRQVIIQEALDQSAPHSSSPARDPRAAL